MEHKSWKGCKKDIHRAICANTALFSAIEVFEMLFRWQINYTTYYAKVGNESSF